MFIVSKALLISSATVIVRAGGAIWLNPFATVLFSVGSAVTVECCVVYPCCMGVFSYVCCYVTRYLLFIQQTLRTSGQQSQQKKTTSLKALAGTNWGQQKETLRMTYKALGRSIANYAAPVTGA